MRRSNNNKLTALALLLALLPGGVLGQDAFQVEDIRFEGLQRISLGTAFTYLPLKVGDSLDGVASDNVIQALYKTGFFHDVEVLRDGNVVLIRVVERPSISSIKIFGNEEIETAQLESALKGVGLSEGRIFNRSLLDQVEQELQRQYFSLGKYGISIKSDVTELERNRVDIQLDINEGAAARIKSINIVGNQAFSDEVLREQFQLSMPTVFSFLSSNDKYSKEKLRADLESLRSYYLDRGYLNFDIASTQVSITPDRRDVFLTINVSEGSQYTVRQVDLQGNMVVPREHLLEQVKVRANSVFSRRDVVDTSNAISERLGIDGYAFANVNAVPTIDEDNKQVSLTFFVDPGNRVYVRRVNVTGNTKTHDEVVRREIRQMEGGWLSTPKVQRSKVRLQRLGFFDDVSVETVRVPNTVDQVDLEFKVIEGSTGSFTAGIGYGETQGLLVNASVTFANFLGTGKRVSTEINRSEVSSIYTLSYFNPYYTVDGVSRGFDLYFRETDAGQANIAAYTTDSYGGKMNFGIPISEYHTARFGFGYERTELKLPTTAPVEYVDWVAANGEVFDKYTVNASWVQDTRDRVIFPESGILQSIGVEMGLPVGDLEYYKVDYRFRWYQPVFSTMIFSLRAEAGYGSGYGEDKDLPFFENYFAGGSRTVRGFRGNSLGPRDSNGDPIGGNKRFVTGVEMIFPSPFSEQSKSFRLSTFVDAGNVFGGDQDFSTDELRAAYGFGAVWITPVGALTFNWAWPLKSEPSDETESFQFSIGAPF